MTVDSSKYRRINLITLLAVYLLIGVGSIVRVLEAGMGCPDWPKCFGSIVPPTSNASLPANYKEVFLAERMEKNTRLMSYLDKLGFVGLSKKISTDPQVEEVHDYNAFTAWVEYINRLIGVVIGFLIMAYAYLSLKFRKTAFHITAISFSALILVIFQGWIGSLVVSTNLIPGFVSFHMGLALLLVLLLVQTYYASRGKSDNPAEIGNSFKGLSLTILILFVPQLLMGTQVREMVDVMFAQGVLRENIVRNFDSLFYVHRSFSLVILGLALYGLKKLWDRQILKTNFGLLWLASTILLILEIGGGAIMAYFAIPRIVQPLHLVGASISLGLIYYLFLMSAKKVAL